MIGFIFRYEENVTMFNSRVTDMIKKCKETLYDEPDTDDPHALR